MEALETHEKIHEAHHGHHGHHIPRNKIIAIMISVLACCLALVETGVNSSQNHYMAANIEASNLWSFYQAKSIRQTSVRTAEQLVNILGTEALTADQSGRLEKQLAEWNNTIRRYDSEPDTGEGRKELSARAKAAEERRDHALSAYHVFEYGAAALQIAIVMASAATVTGVFALAIGAGGFGAVGILLAGLGWFAPTLLHL